MSRQALWLLLPLLALACASPSVPDAGTSDARPPDARAADAAALDAAPADAVTDAAAADVLAEDAEDAGAPDAVEADALAADAPLAADTGFADASAPPDAAEISDTGEPPDAATLVDAGGPLDASAPDATALLDASSPDAAPSGDGGVACGAPFHWDVDPAGNTVGRFTVVTATGRASALTYSNYDDFTSHVLFHTGTSSSPIVRLFDGTAPYNGGAITQPGQSNVGYSAFVADSRAVPQSADLLRYSAAQGTWEPQRNVARLGMYGAAFALLPSGEVLLARPTAGFPNGVVITRLDLAGVDNPVLSPPSFGANLADSHFALDAQGNGTFVVATSNEVLHLYPVRAGVVLPTATTTTPPDGLGVFRLASVPGGDAWMITSPPTFSGRVRATPLHYDPVTMAMTLGPTQVLATGSGRIEIYGDGTGDLSLLRLSNAHVYVHRRIQGTWTPAHDFGLITVNGPDALALDAQGRAYLTYHDVGRQYLARAEPGSSAWTSPVIITQTRGNLQAIGAIGPSGVVVTYDEPTGINGGSDAWAIICR